MSIPKIEGIQKRSVASELRASGTGQGDELSLIGYAALYNSLSKNLGGFREKIAPGAFQRSLQTGADVKALYNHNSSIVPLGRTKSGTLTLSDDAHGLRFRCQLDNRQQGHRDLHAAVSRGDLDECSFAFTVAPGGQDWMENGCTDDDTGENCYMRTLRNVDLLDISIVPYPAYAGTAAGARNLRSLDYRGIAYTPIDGGGDVISLDAHKMVYIRLIVDHPTLGAMGKYTAVTRVEADHLVSAGWAKFERP